MRTRPEPAFALGTLLAAGALLPVQTWAQEAAATPPVPEAAKPAQRVDPFSPAEVFRDVQGPSTEARQRRFVPAITRPARLPELRLRGIAQGDGDDKPTVLLEIKGYGTYVVTEGDTISLQNLASENVIRIKDITRISVIVEAGSFGELIVVR